MLEPTKLFFDEFRLQNIMHLGSEDFFSYTRHANEKFAVLRTYGFSITKAMIAEAVQNPELKHIRKNQILVLKSINEMYALRVIYEKRGLEKVIITFYPVRRSRYGL